jgi:23S rRNA pseudouridine2605 synthase
MNDEKMRLQKYISGAGVTSRRKAEDLIAQGRVMVNGRIVNTPGTLVSKKDTVVVDGKKIRISDQKTYILLNKPEGYVTSLEDQFGRKLVTDLLTDVEKRVFPVGRLDYNTSGLIILTDDGDFANHLTHPSGGIEKEYLIKIDKKLEDKHYVQLIEGIKIEDYVAKPKKVRIISENTGNSYISVTMTEGKNREVRKMFESLGYRVQKLKRIRIGSIEVGFLRKGHYRYLSESEVKSLKKIVVDRSERT